MLDPHITEIEKLVTDYETADKDMTKANVEAAFVARLFAILGWATDDPTVWNGKSLCEAQALPMWACRSKTSRCCSWRPSASVS
jgi:hypothetical protein